jgi:N-acetylglucosamine-6-sulfatase
MRALVLVPALLAILVLATGSPSPGQTPARPNVVVVMSDDQTMESLRVMANVRTLLQAQGTTFSASFASYPLCCPSRSTYLTGQYAHNHGVLSNMPPLGGFTKLDHTNTLPVWLQRAGYHTAHIGKYLNGYRQGVTPDLPPGWTDWYGSYDPTTYRFYDYTLNENGTPVMYGSDPASYQADVYTGKAVALIRRLAPKAQPFFLSVAYLAPHSGGPREPDDPRGQATPVPAPRHKDRFAAEPLPMPPSFNEADVSDKPARIRNRQPLPPQRIAGVTENYRQRLESLLAIDEGVAAIVAALRASGELERTLIVFTSDNGFFHGEHRVPAGKVLVYEPSVRVPLVVRGPGVPRGRIDSRLVANVDLAPTVLDAADAKAGRKLDGRSLLVLLARAQEGRKRDILLETPDYAAVRTTRYVYVEHTTGERELYDLVRDPHQLESRHADPAFDTIRADLARRLAKLRRCAGSACASS